MTIPTTLNPSSPAAAPPDLLPDTLISDALACGRDARSGWGQRPDGWTPERIGLFLRALSQCGVVSDAARHAGMSKQSAYALRNSPKGRAFDFAWRTARLLGKERLSDELMSRALNGCVEAIERDGVIVGRRHRHDNRLAMAVLTRLDTLTRSDDRADRATRMLACEFDALVDSVCAGGEQAADFIASRCALPWRAFDEENIIRRAGGYPQPSDADSEDEDDEEWEEEDWDIADEQPEMPAPIPAVYVRAPVVDPRGETLDAPDAPTEAHRNPQADDYNGTMDSEPAVGPDERQPSTWSTLSAVEDGGSGLETGVISSQVESPDDSEITANKGHMGSIPFGLNGIEPSESCDLTTSSPNSAAAEPVPPVEQWVLGHDGIAVKLVNGRLRLTFAAIRVIGDWKRSSMPRREQLTSTA